MENYGIKPGYEHRTENASIEHAEGDYWSPRRVATSRFFQWSVYELAAALAREQKLARVLDVGCGTGLKLAQILAPVAEAVGVDQASIVQRAGTLNPGVRFVGVDLEKPNQPPHEAFDLLLCVDVIEHLLDPDMLLRYIHDHAGADAWVVISTPDRDVLRGPDNMKSPRAEHVREWNRPELATYLTSRGFQVVRQELTPAFRVGLSRTMLHERWRLWKKGIPLRHCQVAVCRVTKPRG